MAHGSGRDLPPPGGTRLMRTRLLASARNCDEARAALAGGAHIIDLKEPQHGALGAVSPGVIRQVVADVAGRRPVSATVGDLPMLPEALFRAVERTAACGPDFIKVGFFAADGADWSACTEALRPHIRGGLALVAVLFADQVPDLACLPDFSANGFRGVMIDTADKVSGPLTSHWDMVQLEEFVRRVQGLGMIAGLAGGLSLSHIPDLLPLGADYLGFRGALCDPAGRVGTLMSHKVREARTVLERAMPTGSPDAEGLLSATRIT